MIAIELSTGGFRKFAITSDADMMLRFSFITMLADFYIGDLN